MAQVIKSQKGGKILLYQGYSYNFHKNGSEKKIWLCIQNRNHDILGRVHSSEYIPENGDAVQVLMESANHNHTPDAKYDKQISTSTILLLLSTTSYWCRVVINEWHLAWVGFVMVGFVMGGFWHGWILSCYGSAHCLNCSVIVCVESNKCF